MVTMGLNDVIAFLPLSSGEPKMRLTIESTYFI